MTFRLALAVWATCAFLYRLNLDPRRQQGELANIIESVVGGAAWAAAILVVYVLWRWALA